MWRFTIWKLPLFGVVHLMMVVGCLCGDHSRYIYGGKLGDAEICQLIPDLLWILGVRRFEYSLDSIFTTELFGGFVYLLSIENTILIETTAILKGQLVVILARYFLTTPALRCDEMSV